MNGATLKEILGVFDKRWIITAFFPVVFFCLATLALFSTIVYGNLSILVDAPDKLGWTRLSLCLFSLVLLSFVVESAQFHILRFFEGYYWLPYKNRRTADMLDKFNNMRNRVNDKDTENAVRNQLIYELNYYYPLRKFGFMPTRLGNILKSAETYPQDRYGINVYFFWPRLYQILPDRMIELLANSRMLMEFNAAFSAGCYIFGPLWFMGSILLSPLACWTGFAVIGVVAGTLTLMAGEIFFHRDMEDRAMLYGQLIRTSFDLYRFDLLKKLSIPLPVDPDDEKIIWTDLEVYLYRHLRPEYSYKHYNQ